MNNTICTYKDQKEKYNAKEIWMFIYTVTICHNNAILSDMHHEKNHIFYSLTIVLSQSTIYNNESKRYMRYTFPNLNIPHLRPLFFLPDDRTKANPFLESATTFNERQRHLQWWRSAIFSVNSIGECKQGKKVCDKTWKFHLKFIKNGSRRKKSELKCL